MNEYESIKNKELLLVRQFWHDQFKTIVLRLLAYDRKEYESTKEDLMHNINIINKTALQLEQDLYRENGLILNKKLDEKIQELKNISYKEELSEIQNRERILQMLIVEVVIPRYEDGLSLEKCNSLNYDWLYEHSIIPESNLEKYYLYRFSLEAIISDDGRTYKEYEIKKR